MSKTIGNERVLTELAATMADFEPVDLQATMAAPLEESTQDTVAAPSDGTVSAPELPTDEPTHRYVELGELGRGGLGVVVEAFDQDLRRTVALKRPRDDRMTPRTLTSLVAEAQITAQLDHPNIPAVHTLGIDAAGRPFFTMTRLRGQSLADLLRQRREDPQLQHDLSTGRLLRIFLQIGNAVAFAHSRGVLHRDLKPDNVIVGAFGEIRLMDWGIAKVLGSASDDAVGSPTPGDAPETLTPSTVEQPETQAGAFIGTPGFASPEQARGEPDLDVRSDVWALGALLYDMLAGRPPIRGDSVSEVIHLAQGGEVEPIQKHAAVDQRLGAIVHMALSPDRDDRYDNVPDMLADVECLLEGRSVKALEECAVHRLGRWYVSRTPTMARLRNIDIDLLGAAHALGAAALVLLLSPWLARWWAWPLLALGVLAFLPPLYTMVRKPRPDDPGYLLAFGESPASESPLSRNRGSTR